ncbi:hypothetical protein QG37_04357 [Candidozyma auris]|nr:hypothetical protein QG37_04357 [[Candida] auris]
MNNGIGQALYLKHHVTLSDSLTQNLPAVRSASRYRCIQPESKKPKAFVSVPSSVDPEKFRNHPLFNPSFKRFASPMASVSWQSLGVLYDESNFLMPPSGDTICSRKSPSPSQKTLV